MERLWEVGYEACCELWFMGLGRRCQLAVIANVNHIADVGSEWGQRHYHFAAHSISS